MGLGLGMNELMGMGGMGMLPAIPAHLCFVYEFDPHSLKMYPHTKLNVLRQRFQKLSYYMHTDIQTYRHRHIPKLLPHRFASGNK